MALRDIPKKEFKNVFEQWQYPWNNYVSSMMSAFIYIHKLCCCYSSVLQPHVQSRMNNSNYLKN